MRYAISQHGVVIAVFQQPGHRDYLYDGLVKAFGPSSFKKLVIPGVVA